MGMVPMLIAIIEAKSTSLVVVKVFTGFATTALILALTLNHYDKKKNSILIIH